MGESDTIKKYEELKNRVVELGLQIRVGFLLTRGVSVHEIIIKAMKKEKPTEYLEFGFDTLAEVESFINGIEVANFIEIKKNGKLKPIMKR